MARVRSALGLVLLSSVFGATALAAAIPSYSSLSDDLSYATLPDGATVSSMSGSIKIDAAGGPLSLKTLSGDITVHHATSTIDLKSVSGDLCVDTAPGDVTFSTISGAVGIGPVKGSVSGKTVSGAISAGDVTGAAKVSSTSGDVSFGAVGGALDVSTVSGDLTEAAPAMDAQFHSTSGSGKMVLPSASAHREVGAHTVSGDLTVHIPKDFSGVVTLIVRQTDREPQPNIHQSLGLVVTPGSWEKNGTDGFYVSNGTVLQTRRVVATGRVGAGRDTLTLEASRGAVTVVQD